MNAPRVQIRVDLKRARRVLELDQTGLTAYAYHPEGTGFAWFNENNASRLIIPAVCTAGSSDAPVRHEDASLTPARQGDLC